jgi:putative intracellular protease/amidase
MNLLEVNGLFYSLKLEVMEKKVAIIVVNPVNGSGLFQYLETFFENGIACDTFAAARTRDVKTNSGVDLHTDAVIADLKGHEDEYDALVFACGNAMPHFNEHFREPYNQDLMAVVKSFDDKGKMLIGHCAAAMLFDQAGAGTGRRVALHPYVKPHVRHVIGTDEAAVADRNLFTARTENTIWMLLPEVLKVFET